MLIQFRFLVFFSSHPRMEETPPMFLGSYHQNALVQFLGTLQLKNDNLGNHMESTGCGLSIADLHSSYSLAINPVVGLI